jgi:hypothetical protein
VVEGKTTRPPPPPLAPAFRAQLVASFRDEVALLSRLIERDLSHWR